MKKSFTRLLSGALVLVMLLSSGFAVLAEDAALPQPAPEAGSTVLPAEDDSTQPAEDSSELPAEDSSELPDEDSSMLPDDSELPEDGELPDEDDSTLPDDSELPAEDSKPADEETENPADLTEGILQGMPEGYTLSEAQAAEKAALASSEFMQAFAAMQPGTDYREGVVLLPATDEEYARTVAAAYNGTLKSCANGVAEIVLGVNVTTQQAVTASARAVNNLPAVYPNQIVKLNPAPVTQHAAGENALQSIDGAPRRQTYYDYLQAHKAPQLDPYLAEPSRWADYEELDNYQWGLNAIDVYGAWGVTQGSPEITVAVIDTGINAEHEDFAGKTVGVYTAMTDEGVVEETTRNNDDHRSYIDYGDGTTETVYIGHGTHCAGIIAANADNGWGGAGVAPGVSLLSIKVLDSYGYGDELAVARAMNFVTNKGGTPRAQVISMSLGFLFYNPVLESACKDAADAGVAVIAAAGNENTNAERYPARFGSVISVAAVTRGLQRANFSNYGTGVDICAPGENIVSTNNYDSNDGYRVMSGTSQAAPAVAGVVALYYSARLQNGLLPNDLNGDGKTDAKDMALLKTTLQKTGTTPKGTQIGKMVNAANLVNPVVNKPTVEVKTAAGADYELKKPITLENAFITFGGTDDVIIYTLDGKTPTVNYGTVYDGNRIWLGERKAGKCTVKAISVNGMGKASAVVTYTLTLRNMPENYCTSVEFTTCPDIIARGKSAVSKAEVWGFTGELAKYQDVIYSIPNAEQAKYATVSSTGTVTVKANAPAGLMIKVYATSVENPNLSDSFQFAVAGKPIYKVSPIEKTVEMPLGTARKAADMVDLYWDAKTPLTDAEKKNYALNFTLKTSSGKILEMDPYMAKVYAIAPGTAKLTITANDGSKKSTTVTIKVVNVPTRIPDLTSSNYIVKNKTLNLKLGFTADQTSTAVTWSMLPYAYEGVTLSKTGSFKATKAGTYTVHATLNANPAVERYFDITVTDTGVEKIVLPPEMQKFTLLAKPSVNPDGSLVGQSLQLTPMVVTQAGFDKVTYTTSNKKVAAVDENGLVTAMGKGTATITIKAADGSGKYTTCKVTVINPVETITVNSTVTQLARGTSYTPKVTVGPSNASNKGVYYYLADDDIAAGATVDAKTGKITVPADYKPATVMLFVGPKDEAGALGFQYYSVTDSKITSLKLTAPRNYVVTDTTPNEVPSLHLTLNMTTADGRDNGIVETPRFKVEFTSSNPKVATVTNDGVVQAVSKGSVTITARAKDNSGKTATYKVYVYKPATVTVTGNETVNHPYDSEVMMGNTLQLKASVNKDASSKAVTWELVRAPEGVTLSSTGKLSAKNAKTDGFVTIRVTPKYGWPTIYDVTVQNYNNAKLLGVGQKDYYGEAVMKPNGDGLQQLQLYTVQLENSPWDMQSEAYGKSGCDETQATLEPLYAVQYISDNPPVLWSSSNKKVATVDQYGTVRAVGAGTATIKCVADDGVGKKYATVKVVVSVPNTSFTVVDNYGYEGMGFAAYGTTRTLKKTFLSDYGKASTPLRVDASVSLDVLNAETGEEEILWAGMDETADELLKYVTYSSKTGKITVSTKMKAALAAHGYDPGQLAVYVFFYADTCASDDAGGFAYYTLYVTDKVTSLKPEHTSYAATVGADGDVFVKIGTTATSMSDSAFTVKSSNPNVATAMITGCYRMEDGSLWLHLYVTAPQKTGKATITVKANDGSGKSTSFTVKVTQ